MMDRFGDPIVIGWADHQLVWLEAAFSLPRADRALALNDVADLTGRSFAQCYWKCLEIGRQKAKHARRTALVAFAQAHAEKRELAAVRLA